MLSFLHLLVAHGTLLSLLKNHSVHSCGEILNLPNVKIVTMYNPQCLRTMAIYSMNDAGFKARQIKFVSGYRCKESLNIYNRNMTVDQKRNPSYVLAKTKTTYIYHNNTNKSDTSNNLSLILVSVHVLPEIL